MRRLKHSEETSHVVVGLLLFEIGSPTLEATQMPQ